MFGDFVKMILTRVESLGKKRNSIRVTTVSQRDSTRVTKNRDSSQSTRMNSEHLLMHHLLHY